MALSRAAALSRHRSVVRLPMHFSRLLERRSKDLQAGLDTENPHAEGGLNIPDLRVKMNVGLERINRKDRNVLAMIPPDGIDEWVVVGAHYDHLGLGGGNSMADSNEQGKVHPGADDNASGTALVMELADSIARQLATTPKTPRRGLLFALWSGEEIGLLGSARIPCRSPGSPRQDRCLCQL